MGDSTLRRRWTALSSLTASAAPAITPACKAKDLNKSLRVLTLHTLLTYLPSEPAHHPNRLTKRSETANMLWAAANSELPSHRELGEGVGACQSAPHTVASPSIAGIHSQRQ